MAFIVFFSGRRPDLNRLWFASQDLTGDTDVFRVNVEADEAGNHVGAFFRRKRRMSDPKKRVEHDGIVPTVKPDALDGQFRWKGGRVRPLLCPLVNRFVGDEPGVSPAPPVAARRVRPSLDIAFVSVRNANGQTVQGGVALRREMEHVFVAVVEVP